MVGLEEFFGSSHASSSNQDDVSLLDLSMAGSQVSEPVPRGSQA